MHKESSGDERHVIRGACHCGNLSYELTTAVPNREIRARSCDCRFCRIHASINWSDPRGSAIVRVRNSDQLQKYRFASKTTDFFVCRSCGAYLGALISDDRMAWSTLNLRLSDLSVQARPVHYGAEGVAERLARRMEAWTPTRVVCG